jgi:AcrR family transcriptional regulator
MPKVVDHQLYRQELLEKATPLFLQFGFEGLTTRQLARQLGISTGTLYHYFASKDELFEALARFWMDQDMSWVRASFEAIPGRRQRLLSIAAFLQEHRDKFNTQNRLVLQFCQFQQQRGIDMASFWNEIYANWESLTRDTLELRSQFAIDLICQVMDGIFLQWIQGSHSPDLHALFERLAHWLPVIDAAETP